MGLAAGDKTGLHRRPARRPQRAPDGCLDQLLLEKPELSGLIADSLSSA